MAADIERSEKSELLKELFPVARAAGDAIMAIYNRGFDAQIKNDGSPVTEADEAAEAIILDGLRSIAPDIAIISEEDAASHNVVAPDKFFLVDPLDGTREFVKRDDKGAFTVNIALVENGAPVMGIVYAPALDRLFAGVVGEGAVESSSTGSPEIFVRDVPVSGAVAVASVSHRDEQTNNWLNEHGLSNFQSIGSSLKFCLIACGEADIYPRFGPTMEWDTAAGDAILRAAGGTMVHLDGSLFQYGKENFKNGGFFASGRFPLDFIR